MANIKLDFSQFKHKESAKDSTTLEHKKDGHTITLYHKTLSKDNADKLRSLAPEKSDSKSIKAESAAEGVDKANQARKEGDTSGRVIEVNKPESKNYGKVMDPKGEKPQVYAQGGEVKESSWLDKIDKFADDISGQSKQLPSGSGIKRAPAPNPYRMGQKYADGGEVDPINTPELGQELVTNPIDQALQVDLDKPVSAEPAVADQFQTKFDELKKTFPNQPDEVIARTVAKDIKGQQQDQQQVSLDKMQADQRALQQQQTLQTGQQRSQAAVEAAKSSIGMQPEVIPQTATVEANPLAQQAQALPPAEQQAIAETNADPSVGVMQGFDTQIAGQKLQAEALGKQGQAEAQILQKQQENQQSALDAYKSTLTQLNDDLARHEQDIKNGFIDPNKYWTGYTASNGEKVAGHSKMAAAIGMIIAGFNPTSSPNGAEQLLKYQMDQSLEAQKQNLNSSNNLLRANLDHFKNIHDATLMTKSMMADAAVTQLQQAAANAKTPLAQAAALQAIGPLQIQKAQMMRQLSMSQALTKLSQGGNTGDPSNTKPAEMLLQQMYQFAPDQAKELAPRIVPGVGVAPIAVPAEVRGELTGKQQFDQMAQHYVDWVKKNGGTLNPAKISQGAAMAAELQGAYRLATKGGTYKEGEQEFIEKLIPSHPDQWAGSLRTIPKVQELIDQNRNGFEVLKRSYGLPAATKSQSVQPVERLDKATGKTALFDPTTKKFLGYKN